jgi:peptidoglycan/LPS O-acetylase OafA/YrhL
MSSSAINSIGAAPALQPSHTISAPFLGHHIRSLDGVRGLAFCLVFFQHFAGGNHIHLWPIELVRGVGWTGVDLFFVLSGFLITGILYDTRSDTHYLRNFYLRRALRIFPLYYAVLLLILLSTPLLHLHWHLYHLAYPLYTSNFLNALLPFTNTFGFDPWLDLGHFWSLAVEEQFYLIWPFVILLAATRRRIIQACAALILGSILLRAAAIALYLHQLPFSAIYSTPLFQTLLHPMPTPFFYRTFLYRITFFRFDALAMGGIIAMLLRSSHASRLLHAARYALPLLLAVSALLLTRSSHLQTPWTAIPGYTVLAALFASVVVAAIGWAPLRFAFGWSPLRTIGKYSYGMYLFHQIARPALPLLVVKLGRLIGSVSVAAVLCSAGWFITVFLLAKLSFTFFESQFLRLKDRFFYSRTESASATRRPTLHPAVEKLSIKGCKTAPLPNTSL